MSLTKSKEADPAAGFAIEVIPQEVELEANARQQDQVVGLAQVVERV